MKKFLYTLPLLLFGYGCEETCPSPEFILHNQSGGFFIEVTNRNEIYGFFEVEYGLNGFEPGQGTVISVNNFEGPTGLTTAAYDAYVRANCGGEDWSDWIGPKSLLVEGDSSGGSGNGCPQPSNLSNGYTFDNDYRLAWDAVDESDFYELKVGTSGFDHSTVSAQTLSGTSVSDLAFSRGTTYDFYVRSGCSGGEYSTWAGPKTFYADHNANMCLPPENFVAARNGSLVNFSFDANGEETHYIRINTTSSPFFGNDVEVTGESGVLTGVGSGTKYLYIRSLCDSGEYTNWEGPQVLN